VVRQPLSPAAFDCLTLLVSLFLSCWFMVTRSGSSPSQSGEQACVGWGKMASYSEWVPSSGGHARQDWHPSSICAPEDGDCRTAVFSARREDSLSLVHMSGSGLHNTIDGGLVRAGRQASKQADRPAGKLASTELPEKPPWSLLRCCRD
jgi:hypothetical protein